MRSNYDDLAESATTPINEMRARWRAYKVSLLQARHRNEPWDLEYDTWWKIWKPHWHQRGRDAECIQMSRRSEQLPWCESNIVMRTKKQRYRNIEPGLDPQTVD